MVFRILLLAAALWSGVATVRAADLVIGRATENPSVDPQFASTGTNIDTATDMFDRLLATDPQSQPLPALAASWKNLDPLTWEIQLRPGVSFQDGTPLTAADVVFSLERAKAMPNSPAPYFTAVRAVAGMQVTGPLTLRVTTTAPTPLLMEQIGEVFILSAKAAAGMSTSDMNQGRGMIGTGPYRFVRWLPGQQVEMVRNPAYWGGMPAWEHVTLKFIPQSAARVAALLSGDVGLIDQIPPADAKQIGANPKLSLVSTASTRLVYIALDSARTVSPLITDMKGAPLDRNPLQDRRVRLAMSAMIDRDALTGRLLDGSAEPAGQMVPQGMGGYDPGLVPQKLDLKRAHDLLAEAGWGGGFGLTLDSSSDRLPQDGAVAQALGQMLRRGGLAVNGVVTVPYNVYAAAASRQAYSAFVFSIGATGSNAMAPLASVLSSYDPAHGLGAFNRSRYANPEFDALLATAQGTFDETARNAMLQQATALAMHDGAILPLYWQVVHWGMRKDISYIAHRGEDTAARFASPQ